MLTRLRDNAIIEPTAATIELQRSIHRRKAERAKLMSIDERLAAGAKLFEEQKRFMLDMIAGLHADWNANQVDVEVRRRLAVKRLRDNAGLYRNVVTDDEGEQ